MSHKTDTGDCPEKRLGKHSKLAIAKRLLPEIPRFSICQAHTKKRAHFIGAHAAGGNAWFRGTYECGSVWICPVCAPRIAARRREEVQTALDHAIAQGCGALLVTLTFPHGAGDILQEILDKFSRAQRMLKSGNTAKALQAPIGYQGEIRTLEVTHGGNGWHPHAHSIWITDRQLSQAELTELREKIYAVWRRVCLKVGLPEPSAEHGVDVRGARYAADYVAKWGFATEIAAATSKRGKGESGGRTPWELLADASNGDQRSAWLWREFALAFFGKRQLFWSRGLRDSLQLGPELTDQEELTLANDKSKLVLAIDLDTWSLIVREGLQDEVLFLAVRDIAELKSFLNHLRSTVPNERGQFYGPREDWVA